MLSLEISDNGRGLSQDDLAKARSFGIRGLHERANTVGGWIDLSSGAQGTTLILSVPLDLPDSVLVPEAEPDRSDDSARIDAQAVPPLTIPKRPRAAGSAMPTDRHRRDLVPGEQAGIA